MIGCSPWRADTETDSLIEHAQFTDGLFSYSALKDEYDTHAGLHLGCMLSAHPYHFISALNLNSKHVRHRQIGP